MPGSLIVDKPWVINLVDHPLPSSRHARLNVRAFYRLKRSECGIVF
jgi:hypothetical protein